MLKCENEVENLIKFINENKQKIIDFKNEVEEKKVYVKSAIDYIGYDIMCYYCYKVYNTPYTYCYLYDKYNCNDNHIKSLFTHCLKVTGII